MPTKTTNQLAAERVRVALAGQGLLGETFNRGLAGGSFAPTAGDMRATLTGLLQGDVITNLWVTVTVAGSGVTLAKMAIWDTAGALLASSATVHTQFTSGTGIKGGALSAAYTSPSTQAVFVGFVMVGGTAPTILRGTSGITGYASGAASGGVIAAAANTGQTDIGALTLTGSGTAPWVGWS